MKNRNLLSFQVARVIFVLLIAAPPTVLGNDRSEPETTGLDLRGQSVGIEIEGQIPKDGRINAVRGLQTYLQQILDAPVTIETVELGAARHSSRSLDVTDILPRNFGKYEYRLVVGKNKSIKIAEDTSIDPQVGYGPFEIASQTITNEQDLMIFILAIDFLKTEHAFLDVASHGGVHVHVGHATESGEPSLNTAELALLARIFDKIEPEIAKLLAISLLRREFIEALPQHEITILNMEEPHAADITNVLNQLSAIRDEGGYHIRPATSHKTFETRHANSTLRWPVIGMYTQFIIDVVSAVRTGKLTRHDLPGLDLKTLTEKIGSNFMQEAGQLSLTLAFEYHQDLRRNRSVPNLSRFERAYFTLLTTLSSGIGCWTIFQYLL